MEVTKSDALWNGALAAGAPRSVERLWMWVNGFCRLRLPTKRICACHNSPAEYMFHAFNEGLGSGGDCVVWACRGGGKTQLGAAATLLDMVYKPGIQIRILGGSLDQSGRMYEHLRRMMRGPRLAPMLEGKIGRQGFSLKNGSRVEILAQSDTAVRGQRVQKLRCDEVELFNEDVWQAAQLMTRSASVEAGKEQFEVKTAVEAVSTMHLPGGLMQRLVEQSPQLGRKVFTWCIMDVIENCHKDVRSCTGCELWDECLGRAREADGFMKVEDLMAMKRRVSRSVWESEMLCKSPRFEHAVFGTFHRAVHVREFEVEHWERIGDAEVDWFCGVDFGFAGAFVCVWMALERVQDGRLWVFDELVEKRQVLSACVAKMAEKSPGMSWIRKVFCDAAGKATNGQSGKSDMGILKDAGYTVGGAWQKIDEGLEKLRALLLAADRRSRLVIHPRCEKLIAAMEGYCNDPATGEPVKDGVHDHLIDALRYGVMGVLGKGTWMGWY